MYGRVVLAHDGLEDYGTSNLSVHSGQRAECLLEHPLASNFSILLGSINVTVPDVEPGDDYAIVCE